MLRVDLNSLAIRRISTLVLIKLAQYAIHVYILMVITLCPPS
jgi:hypothetical protein